jgi:hypothetical protein
MVKKDGQRTDGRTTEMNLKTITHGTLAQKQNRAHRMQGCYADLPRRGEERQRQRKQQGRTIGRTADSDGGAVLDRSWRARPTQRSRNPSKGTGNLCSLKATIRGRDSRIHKSLLGNWQKA